MKQEERRGTRLRIQRSFTVPKDGRTPNEDRFASSEDGTAVAVSDGASVSFDPGPWAEALVAAYLAAPDVSVAWLSQASSSYQSRYDRDGMEWMMQAAFDRGSFATLAGVRITEDDVKAYVFAIGDTQVVVLDGHSVVTTFPYERPEQFDDVPTLLCSNMSENRQITDGWLKERGQPVHLSEIGHPAILVMTDALGRWLMERQAEAAVEILMNLTDAEMFSHFVEEQRAAGNLRKDDTTLVVLA